MLPHACTYVYIRALGFVAVTVSMVLQSYYLASKDIATPIKVCPLGGVVLCAETARYLFGGLPATTSGVVCSRACASSFVEVDPDVVLEPSHVFCCVALPRDSTTAADCASTALPPLQSVAGASVANLVLDCIAVFGFGMGIKGAALSTTVAQWVGLLYLVKEVRALCSTWWEYTSCSPIPVGRAFLLVFFGCVFFTFDVVVSLPSFLFSFEGLSNDVLFGLV